jgi:hypothetical protein
MCVKCDLKDYRKTNTLERSKFGIGLKAGHCGIKPLGILHVVPVHPSVHPLRLGILKVFRNPI